MSTANGVDKKAAYGGRIVALVVCVAALAGILHYVQRAHAIKEEVESGRSQCMQVIGKAATKIAAQRGVNWKVTDPVQVERSIDRGTGPDTLDCTVTVMFYPNGAPKVETGAEDKEPWILTGHPGGPFTLVSARFMGQEQVGQ
jgi:hypothetical protein